MIGGEEEVVRLEAVGNLVDEDDGEVVAGGDGLEGGADLPEGFGALEGLGGGVFDAEEGGDGVDDDEADGGAALH